MRGRLQALFVQHVADRAGIGSDSADLSVDGQRHGLLGGDIGQRAAEESQEDDGEQTELERAAHNTSTGSQNPGRRTRPQSEDGAPVAVPFLDGVEPGVVTPGRGTPSGSVSTPAVGHDTITRTVRGAMVRTQ
jgi:hypothetical protein